MKLTDDVKQRKQKHFKQYRTAKQKLTNKESLVRFLHRGKPLFRVVKVGSIGLPNQITKIPSEYVILEQFREIHVIISRRGLDW